MSNNNIKGDKKSTTMKFILTLLTLLLFQHLFGQRIIENKLTEAHQNIKGTKISLIPPDGFTDGQNFLGLQQAEMRSSILVLDIPGPYTEISAGINKKNLQSKGIELQAVENLTINSLPAIFVTGTQKASGTQYTKYILVFGTESETIMINGVHPDDLKLVGEQIRNAMYSVYYEADKNLDPLAALDYTIDVSQTKLKFGKSMSNSLIFTVDGQVPTASSDKTNLIVAKSFYQINIDDKKRFCLNRLKQTPIEISSIVYTKEITIDGMSGYEIYAKGSNNETNETENIYQVILFSDKLYYILFGTTNDQTDQSIEEMKKAIMTFRRKSK
jgi:hypothetical protein